MESTHPQGTPEWLRIASPAPDWYHTAEDHLYQLEQHGERNRAAFRALDDERINIGSELDFHGKELRRLNEAARLTSMRSTAGVQHAQANIERDIAVCEQRIARLNERLNDANARQSQLSKETLPFTRLLEGARRALAAVRPTNI